MGAQRGGGARVGSRGRLDPLPSIQEEPEAATPTKAADAGGAPSARSARVLVPEGTPAGARLQHVTPDGQELTLTVPEGMPAGWAMVLVQDPATQKWTCSAEPPEEAVAPPSEGEADAVAAPEQGAAPEQISIVVPEGAGPGTELAARTPDGAELSLTVPEGVPPGSRLTLTRDPDSGRWKCAAEPPQQSPGEPEEPPQPRCMRIVVPDGAAPGTRLTRRTPDGQELDLTVPEGVPPGTLLELSQDPSTKRWRCSVASPSADGADAAAAAPAPEPGGRGCAGESPESEAEAPQSVSIEVPLGAVPGTLLHQKAPDGVDLDLTVPDGVPGGSTLTLTKDPATQRWVCTAVAPPPDAGGAAGAEAAGPAALDEQQHTPLTVARVLTPDEASSHSDLEQVVDATGVHIEAAADATAGHSAGAPGDGGPQPLSRGCGPAAEEAADVAAAAASAPPPPPPPGAPAAAAAAQEPTAPAPHPDGPAPPAPPTEHGHSPGAAAAQGEPSPPSSAPPADAGCSVVLPPTREEESTTGAPATMSGCPSVCRLQEQPEALRGEAPLTPAHPASAAPAYCCHHRSSERRPKGESRLRECMDCQTVVETNYLEFSLCITCSDRRASCMVCGAAASAGGAPPEPQPAAAVAGGAPACEDPPVPRCQLAPGMVPPRYCPHHSTSAQRTKSQPRMWECTGCGMEVQTNYSDFRLCGPCSDKEMRCMICGADAPCAGTYVPASSLRAGSGAGAGAPAPQLAAQQGGGGDHAQPPPSPPGAPERGEPWWPCAPPLGSAPGLQAPAGWSPNSTSISSLPPSDQPLPVPLPSMVAPQLQGVSLFGPPPGAGVPAAGAWGPHSPPPGGGPCGGPPRPLGVAPGPAGVPGPRPPMQPFFGIPFPQRGQPPQFTFHRTDVPPPHMASMMPPPGSGCKHHPNPQHVGLLNAGGA